MQYKMLIDGNWTDARNGGAWHVHNPATEQRIATVPFGGADEVTAAIDAADRALPAWQAMTAYDRGAILRDIADAIRRQVDTLAPIMTAECGKPLAEAAGEWGRVRRPLRLVRRRRQTRLRTDDPRPQSRQTPALPAAATGHCRHRHRLELPGLFVGAEVGGGAGGRLRDRRQTQRAHAHERHGAGECHGRGGHPARPWSTWSMAIRKRWGAAMLSDPRVRKLSFTGSQRRRADTYAAGGGRHQKTQPGAGRQRAGFGLRRLRHGMGGATGRVGQVSQQRASLHLADALLCAAAGAGRLPGRCQVRDRKTGGRRWHGQRRNQRTHGHRGGTRQGRDFRWRRAGQRRCAGGWRRATRHGTRTFLYSNRPDGCNRVHANRLRRGLWSGHGG